MQNICFIFSLAFLIAFFVLSIIERRSRSLGETQQWILRIVKFCLLVFSGGTLYFGCEFAGSFSIQNVAESLYSAVKLFFGDGTLYDAANQTLPEGSILTVAYFVLYYIICGIAVYCTAAAVISLFKNVAALGELKRRGRHKNLCVFSELSEKTLAIAQSIRQYSVSGDTEDGKGFFTCSPNEMNGRAKLCFVFCEVFEQNAERHYELTEGARKLGALCVKQDITEVHAHLRRAKCYKNSATRITRFFLAGQDEAENVRQAIIIADTEKSAEDKKRIRNLAIFTFANGEVNGEVLDSLNSFGEEKASFFVRRLNPAVMLAYNLLANETNYLVDNQNPEKDLKVLVAGMGQYGTEIIKMLCWFYQRRRGGISIHVVDREVGIADRMRALYPALTDYTLPQDPTDDMCCSLVFHEGVDLFSGTFSDMVKTDFADIDAAFITLGDDDVNAEAAVHLRRQLDRAHYNDIAKKTKNYIVFSENETTDLVHIFAVVHNDKRCNNFVIGKHYGIRFVGNDSIVYTYGNIYEHNKENAAISEHQSKRHLATNTQAVNSYNASEQDRLSSLARTYHDDFYHFLYADNLQADDALEQRRRTENKRWNAYMRTCGYVCMDNALSAAEREDLFLHHKTEPQRQWSRGRWHNSIAPYSRMGATEQANNFDAPKE